MESSYPNCKADKFDLVYGCFECESGFPNCNCVGDCATWIRRGNKCLTCIEGETPDSSGRCKLKITRIKQMGSEIGLYTISGSYGCSDIFVYKRRSRTSTGELAHLTQTTTI